MSAEPMTVRESIIRLAAYIEFLDCTEKKQSRQTYDLIIMLLKRKKGLVE